MRYFVGIDNASLTHKVQILDSDGNQKSAFIIANTLEGFEKLNDSLNTLRDIVIGFELPHGPLVDYLHLKGYQMYTLNPLKIKRFKESLKVSGNKNDAIDALAIAEYLRANATKCKPMLYNSPEIERLKILAIIHNRLTGEHARYVNKLHFSVRQYFYLHENLFTDFGCTVQLKMLIKFPTCNDLKRASKDEIIQFLKQSKYCNPTNIARLLEKISPYNQVIAQEVEYAYQFEVECICRILLTLKNELKRIEKEMKVIIDIHRLGKCFKSLSGAGVLLASKLLAIFGDNKDRFGNANEAQCLFGTAPKNYQSGSYHKVVMRKACNKSARAILFQFAFSSLNYSLWARKYHDNQKAKGKKHTVAVRALSNKWVEVIYKIWKDEIFYEEDKKFSSAA